MQTINKDIFDIVWGVLARLHSIQRLLQKNDLFPKQKSLNPVHKKSVLFELMLFSVCGFLIDCVSHQFQPQPRAHLLQISGQIQTRLKIKKHWAGIKRFYHAFPLGLDAQQIFLGNLTKHNKVNFRKFT